METKFAVLSLVLALARPLSAQTTDDYVTQGRTFLTATNIVAANGSFSNAVALSPNHQTANAFYAGTRLLVLPYQPAGSNFLNRIGVKVTGRDIYNWTADFPSDADGVPLAPVGLNANESAAMLRTNILPALIAAEANLAKVTDTDFTLSLTSNETRFLAVTLDYGDMLMLRAMLQAAEYLAYTTYSWNLDAQLAAIRSLYTNDELSIERVLMDFPNLLTLATTNDLNAAKLAFRDGVDQYMEASLFIRNRSTNLVRLFNYDAGMADAEEEFRATLTDLTDSLITAVTLSAETNYTVFLGSHFSGLNSPRSFLPLFPGNGFGLGTLPDSTFGGLIYGLSGEQVDDFLARILFPVPTISPVFSTNGGHFRFPVNVLTDGDYVVQVSTNLTSWVDLVGFLASSNSHSFVDPNLNSSSRHFYRVRTGQISTTVALNVPVPELSGASGSQKHFVVTIPAGKSSLQITVTGGPGDCDLYVRFGAQPTLSSWDYRPFLGGNNESVTIPSPTTGSWNIMLHGFSSYSGVTMLAQ